MEQGTAEPQGKFSGGGGEEKQLEGNSVRKYTLSPPFFFFPPLNLTLPGIVLGTFPDECGYK